MAGRRDNAVERFDDPTRDAERSRAVEPDLQSIHLVVGRTFGCASRGGDSHEAALQYNRAGVHSRTRRCDLGAGEAGIGDSTERTVAGIPIECQRQNGTAPVLPVELKLVRGVGQAVSVKVCVDLVLQGDVADSRRKTRRITWVSAMPCFVDIREAVGVAIGE